MTDYPTNLNNSQWQIISKFLNTRRSRKYSLREIINAILYVIKSGCQWRMLPSGFPKWQIVYYYFSQWNKNGIIEQIHVSLVIKMRRKDGRKRQPSVGIIDTQTVKSTWCNRENKGFDAAKRITGIKRHLIVDSLGLILDVVIQSGSLQDRDGAIDVIEKTSRNWNKIVKIFGDGGYRGVLIEKTWLQFKISIEIIKRNELSTFKVLPKRWVVERTFAWIDTNRRSARNYERLNITSRAIVLLASIRMMLNHF